MFFEILKDLCSERGTTITGLTAELGISRSNVTNWKNGSVPKSDIIGKIANYFNVSADYILGNEQKKEASTFDVDAWVEKHGIKIGDTIPVPILGRVRAGVGGLLSEDIIGTELVETKAMRRGESYFWLLVEGDSMYPKILPDDLVLVRQQTSVDSGSTAIVSIDDEEGVVKKVCYGSDWIELKSCNPDYEVRRFDGYDILRIRVIGKVLEIKRKIN